MQKHNFFFKKLKKRFLSLNFLIERYFNQLKNLKKINFIQNNKIILIFGGILILIMGYFLIPTFYDKNSIKLEIKKQILKKYDFDVKFNEEISYGLLPKPHFVAKNSTIIRNKKNIAEIKNFKIFISINDLISKNLQIKDLVINRANFNIYKDDLSFFNNLLKTEPNEHKILINNSNIFFKSKNDEILFINKVYNSKFFFDFNNLKNSLSSKNEIFNIPFKILIENDKFNKEVFFKFNSKKIRLDLENITSYNNKDIKQGTLEISLINDSSSFDYQIKKDSFNFKSENTKNNYYGKLDFKPFYFYANFNYEGMSSKRLFENDSILYDIIGSEILNNLNLNINIDFNIKDIVNVSELNNLFLKVSIEQGEINLDDSTILWKEDLKISLKKAILNMDKEKINLVGKVQIDFYNDENFYRSFQVKKNLRKDLKEMQFDFIFDLNQRSISFDNIKVDGKNFSKLDEFINNFNSKKNRNFNKVKFKNFVNNFFSAYAG